MAGIQTIASRPSPAMSNFLSISIPPGGRRKAPPSRLWSRFIATLLPGLAE
jgi:hypothetical protein